MVKADGHLAGLIAPDWADRWALEAISRRVSATGADPVLTRV